VPARPHSKELTPVHLRDSPPDHAFRTALRGWLADTLPSLPPAPAPDDWPARRAYDARWQRLLFEAGYAGIHWPREFGGRGASPTEQLVFLEETALAGAPDTDLNFVALLHAGPTLIMEGTREQQQFHLPRILRGESVWCQGFSEPGAGSDLASLRTRAVRDGDHYVVTGQKIWTSGAEIADYCELLVRTDPDAPKHQGISWLILPMATPGVEVRPLRTMQGGRDFAELFLDRVRVRVPAANLVGAENDGWRVAMVTFGFERGTAFVREMLDARRLVVEVAQLVRSRPPGSGLGWDDAGLRREIGVVAAELDALWALTKRNVSRAQDGPVPVAGGSAFKLFYGEARHHLGDVVMRVLDRAALSAGDVAGLPNSRLVDAMTHGYAVNIAAGTTQIQRNIVAERVLGLPKER